VEVHAAVGGELEHQAMGPSVHRRPCARGTAGDEGKRPQSSAYVVSRQQKRSVPYVSFARVSLVRHDAL
jgi:hypothetical protein